MENNKLIAEFMGYIYEDDILVPEELQYDTSWDWLLPVVEKIEEIAVDDDDLTVKEHRYQVDMSYTQCSIYDRVRDGGEPCNSEYPFLIASADMGTKLSSTHRAVIEFIKEYNNG